MMPLESFPPGFFLKEDPVEEENEIPFEEQPVEENEQPDTPQEETPQEPEEQPEPPQVVYSVQVRATDKQDVIHASWRFDGYVRSIEFILYVNGSQRAIVKDMSTYLEVEYGLGQTFAIVARDTETGLSSERSLETTFDVLAPTGFNNANYWIPAKIDNISVTYRK